MFIRFVTIFILFNFILCNRHSQLTISSPAKFQLGDEVLLSKNLASLNNKNIAVLTNQSGILSDGTQIIDALLDKGIKVIKIFSPEHGIRGDENYFSVDEKTQLPIISLYGDKKKPSFADLSDVDIIIYDIQDVGARYYTYTSTLYYAIQSAVENKKKIIVCDRPMILNQGYVDGFILQSPYESFVGKIPTPICYGMTCGELANYLNGELFSNSEYVEVIKMENYTRSSNFDDLNIKWVKPSPSIYYSSSAVCYPATCFLEGTNVSEGRGTDKPFEYCGAPWCNGELLAKGLNSLNLNGVIFESVTFTPSQKISSVTPKFFNRECSGVSIKVTDKNKFEPVKSGVAILVMLNKYFNDFKFNKDNFIDKLAGTEKLRTMISNGEDYNTIVGSWSSELDSFIKVREKIFIILNNLGLKIWNK